MRCTFGLFVLELEVVSACILDAYRWVVGPCFIRYFNGRVEVIMYSELERICEERLDMYET
jgi:hypothetical protein